MVEMNVDMEAHNTETIQINLTRGFVCIIDAIDADLNGYKWFATTHPLRAYAARTKKLSDVNSTTTQLLMHRIIIERVIGRTLEAKEFVDHIDNNSMNNRRSNLRICNQHQNMGNSKKRKDNKSGYKGVSLGNQKSGKMWYAYIVVRRKTIYLGNYLTPEEAHVAYCEAAKRYFGEFARGD